MSARDWQPGDKALIEVEVVYNHEGGTAVLVVGPKSELRPEGWRQFANVDANALHPVPAAGEAATEDVIERVAESLAAEIHEAWEFQYDQCDHGTYRGGYLNGKPYAMCEITAERIVRRRADAGLLAGGVPGRSESEGTLRIEGDWLVRSFDHCTCSPHYGAHERHCGMEPEVDLSTLPGWRSEAEIKAEALREAADQLTEIADDYDTCSELHAALRECDLDTAHWLRARADRNDSEGAS